MRRGELRLSSLHPLRSPCRRTSLPWQQLSRNATERSNGDVRVEAARPNCGCVCGVRERVCMRVSEEESAEQGRGTTMDDDAPHTDLLIPRVMNSSQTSIRSCCQSVGPRSAPRSAHLRPRTTVRPVAPLLSETIWSYRRVALCNCD